MNSSDAQQDRREAVREKIVNVLGLEIDPFGDPEHLLTYDDRGEVQDGVDMHEEVDQLAALIDTECLAVLDFLKDRAYEYGVPDVEMIERRGEFLEAVPVSAIEALRTTLIGGGEQEDSNT